MTIRIEVLERRHRALLGDFQNQHRSLVDYLKRFVLCHGEKDFLSRTHLAIDRVDDVERIAGYFSLSMVSVERSSAGMIPELDRLPRFPIPGVLLARLAVNNRAQGQGLGRFLFEEALGKTLELARTGPVVFRLLVTDAIDASAAQFYGRVGLVALATEFPCRMVLDLWPLISPVGTKPPVAK